VFNLKEKKIVFFAVSVVLLLALSVLIPLLRNPLIHTTKYPLSFLTGFGREINGIIFYHRNYTENQRLKKEIDKLKRAYVEVSENYFENKRLKELLLFKQKSPLRFAVSRVIGRDPANWSASIIIDKGRSSGIKKGYICITYSGLVGRVIEAGATVSKVMLINDPKLGVSAIVQRSRQEGLVCGSLSGSLIMRYLSNESDIKNNDTIVTSGLTEIYPKGLLIGTVVGIGEDLSGLSRYAIIRPSVNLATLEEVLVIIP
jgi:rod shape-determining protein MreC